MGEVLGGEGDGPGLDRFQRGGHVVERPGGGHDLPGAGIGKSFEVEVAVVHLLGGGGQPPQRPGEHPAGDDDPAEADESQHDEEGDFLLEVAGGLRGLRQRRVVQILRRGDDQLVQVDHMSRGASAAPEQRVSGGERRWRRR